MKKKLVKLASLAVAVLATVASVAHAQASFGEYVGQMQANDDFIAQRALWYTVTDAGWSVHLLEDRCPNGGRVAVMDRFGKVGLVGCYLYQKKREGFSVAWENGVRIFYGDEQMRTTLHGQNQAANERK